MKELVFKKWLEGQGVDTDYFWKKCKRKNQGRDNKLWGTKRSKLKMKEPQDWLLQAFIWRKTKQGHKYWHDVNIAWGIELRNFRKLMDKKVQNIVFGFWHPPEQGWVYWDKVDTEQLMAIVEKNNNKPYKIEFGFGKDK